eukprot:11663610-Heterocapsa_arctica.AAC.1
MSVNGAEHPTFLPSLGCPVVKWSGDVKVLVVFARVEDDQVGDSFRPFAFDLIEIPIVLDLLGVENGE